MTTRRPWTRREEDRLRELRAAVPRLTNVGIGRALGRSEGAVRMKLRELGLSRSTRRPPGGLADAVRRMIAPGVSDTDIARELKVRRNTVTITRQRLGLSSGVTNSEAARRGGVARWAKAGLPRCMACGAIAPHHQVRKLGWVSRPLRGYSDPQVREVYCASCYREWGWGDAKGVGA